MAISNDNVVPILIAGSLLEQYRKSRVYAARTNRSWQSLVALGGDIVRVTPPVAATIADYVVGTAISYGRVDVGTAIDIPLNKQKYAAVKVDSIDAMKALPNLISAGTTESAEALAGQVDADVRAEMLAGSTLGPSVALDHSETLSGNSLRISAMHRLLDLASVPRAGRWMIIGPYTAEVLQAYALQNAVIAAPYIDRSGLINGGLGSFAGFDLYVDNGAYSTLADTDPADDPLTSQATETLFYGNDTAVAFLERTTPPESLRLEDEFADAVRMLQVYGSKTVYADRIFRSEATIAKVPKS